MDIQEGRTDCLYREVSDAERADICQKFNYLKTAINIYVVLKHNIKLCNAKRRWQQKPQKKTLPTCSTLFLYISLPFVLPKTSLSYTFYGGNVVCVPSVHLLFSMPLIFILMAASTSHFPAAAIKFSCYSSYVITLPCYLSLFLLQMLKFKLSQKKELALLLLLFLSLKSRWLCDLPLKCLGMSIKFSFPRRADS